MKDVVLVTLAVDEMGSIDRTAPFAVYCPRDRSLSGVYIDEPGVLAQMHPSEHQAWFEAEWEGEWKFGKRVQDG